MKSRGEKIPMVTAYDAPTACLADSAGFPMILVGDSLGMVVLGHESTIPVTMEDMVRHTAAVSRRAKHSLIVADMPFMSFRVSAAETARNAGRLVQEGGAQVVKLEGGVSVAEEVRRVVETGIPVMGHIGLTPQSVNRFGGYKVQGKGREEAKRLLEDAMALQEAGAFSVVLELMPSSLAKLITARLSIPTIGIGAGPHCDGQVQVFHDLMGFYGEFVPKHTKQYLNLNELVGGALKQYAEEVREGAFPTEKEGFAMDESVLEGL
jgi:3-methyl-2-oxobutanoate hydroxymethyltransferase